MMRKAFIPHEQALGAPSEKTFSPAITALGTIWTSGCTAVRFDPASKRMVVQGDLVEQASIALDKIKAALAAGDLGLGSITAIVQYLAPAALGQLERLPVFYSEAFAGRVPLVNTVVVKRLLRETAMIEIEAIASRGTESALEYLPAVSGGYPDGARAGAERLLDARGLTWRDVAKATEFVVSERVAGMHVGVPPADGLQIVMPRIGDADAGAQLHVAARRSHRVVIMSAYGEPAAGDVVEQCRRIYADLARRLALVDSGLDAVVKTTEFVTPAALAAYKGTAEIRRQIFAPPYPAATGVVCESVGKPGCQIAVELVAVRKET